MQLSAVRILCVALIAVYITYEVLVLRPHGKGAK